MAFQQLLNGCNVSLRRAGVARVGRRFPRVFSSRAHASGCDPDLGPLYLCAVTGLRRRSLHSVLVLIVPNLLTSEDRVVRLLAWPLDREPESVEGNRRAQHITRTLDNV